MQLSAVTFAAFEECCVLRACAQVRLMKEPQSEKETQRRKSALVRPLQMRRSTSQESDLQRDSTLKARRAPLLSSRRSQSHSIPFHSILFHSIRTPSDPTRWARLRELSLFAYNYSPLVFQSVHTSRTDPYNSTTPLHSSPLHSIWTARVDCFVFSVEFERVSTVSCCFAISLLYCSCSCSCSSHYFLSEHVFCSVLFTSHLISHSALDCARICPVLTEYTRPCNHIHGYECVHKQRKMFL